MSSLVKGSLTDIARDQNKSIAETFLSVDAIILVDVSASMDSNDCPDNRRRWDVACEQLIALQRQLSGKLAVVGFSAGAFFCPGGVPPAPMSTTNLTGALEFVRPADGCGIRLIVISDGEPDNAITALALARQFQTKIDTVYVGPELGAGRDFLKQLADASGGQFANQSVNHLPELAQTVTQLLAA